LNFRSITVGILVSILALVTASAHGGFSIEEDIVSGSGQADAFPLVTSARTAPIWCDGDDFAGVVRAVGDLQMDVERVTGKRPKLVSRTPRGASAVLVGTVGKSAVIQQLVDAGKLDVSELAGKWECFIIATVDAPLPGLDRALVIAGSDKRGTIYGIYELVEQLGVSPWYWWADVPAKKKDEAYVLAGRYVSAEPAVKYRGIFINDENPAFGGWTNEKFGGVNSKMYAHMFELILRLRGNYLWPAMWGKAFNEDDPANPRVADEYGIVMGTSHHEPMMRAQAEWGAHRGDYGNGQWDYKTNEAGLREFWRDGFERNKDYDNLVTMGMRGDGDEPMNDAGSAEAGFRLMANIITDQRQIIEEVTGKPASETPQMWALYKEVLEYFDQGLDVPEDVIIVVCDDNWGDIRRLPELDEPRHPGGYGIYYHVDYHGAPRSYQWLNMTQIPNMWEQLQLTYDYGVDKVWILNVGDLKPMEYPISFFLSMAWNPDNFDADNLGDFTREFCAAQFGDEYAEEAARILDKYCKYSSRITAEMLDHETYNLQSGEFEMVKNEFLALETYATRQFAQIPETAKDAYKELILFPVQAMANLYDLYYAVAMNRKLASEGDLAANFWADRVDEFFERDAALTYDYNHNIADGKWNHMMDQVHIGYSSWNEPPGGKNIKPEVQRISPDDVRRGGCVFTEKAGVVVMEGEHYFSAVSSEGTVWTVIPDLGRTLSSLALMPYTESTDGAELRYKMKFDTEADSVTVHIFFDSTLPFKKGAHSVAARFEGGDEKTWVINEDLTWANNYSRMYPTSAARLNEQQVTLKLPPPEDGAHTLVLRPLDPGLGFYKIVVDLGGYEQTFLKMNESPYEKK
jgi:hypothetical protein